MGGKKGFTPEQIIGKLRQAEVLVSKGSTKFRHYARPLAKIFVLRGG